MIDLLLPSSGMLTDRHLTLQNRSTRSVEIALTRQRADLSMAKREQWSEADIDALAAEEPDFFERKSGRILEDQSKFLDLTAKTLSAFANSGGGSLILGVEDDGTPSGIQPRFTQTSSRDWIEQKIPYLLDYPLSDFRVHTVIRCVPSRIPPDREVIVIDVGDSALAPHQSKRDHRYYHRVGGRSLPAPHFYIELLRQRLTSATLEFRLRKFIPVEFIEHDGGMFLESKLIFEIDNVGRLATYKWHLAVRQYNHESVDFFSSHGNRCYFGIPSFPVKRVRSGGIFLDTTILPGCTCEHTLDVGFLLSPVARTEDAVGREISDVVKPITLGCRLSTETNPGEIRPIPLEPVVDVQSLVAFARERCSAFFSDE